MTHYLGAVIRPRGNSFMADLCHKYARYRKTFDTVAEAKGWIDRLQVQILNNGAVLSHADIAAASDVIRRLPPGVTLPQLLEFWETHHVTGAVGATLKPMVHTYIERKRLAGRRNRTVKDAEWRLGRLAQDLGDIPVVDIGTKQLEAWMDSKGFVGVSRKNYRTAMMGFFNYAISSKAILSNPAKDIALQSIDERMPEILTIAQVRTLLRSAKASRPEMVPWLAIGLFAGLRTAELFQLRWENVDLRTRLITVRPETAKRRRQRHVTVSENLAAWLTDYAVGSGRVCPGESTVRKWITGKTGVLKAAGLSSWPHNAMRHSFGSYHLAKHLDAPRTAFEMGHTTPDLLYNHYRNLVKPEEAAAYWEITPETPAAVVQLPAASA